MEFTRLILVIEILVSTWSNADHGYTGNDFDFAALPTQYTSSPYGPRSIQDNTYIDKATTSRSKPGATSELLLDVGGESLVLKEDSTKTPTTLNEKEIISDLLRYGQHHQYILKSVLRGMKLLRDWSISDIRLCAREALSQPDELQPLLPMGNMGHNEEKYIVKVLLTEPNYMEFCVQKAARNIMRKQLYESLVTDMSSIITGRQMQQLETSPTATTLIGDTEQTTSTYTGPVGEIEQSTTLLTSSIPSGETNSPAEAEQTTSSLVNLETLDSREATEPTEDTHATLNKEILTYGSSNQFSEPYQNVYPTIIPKRIHQNIPLIYNHGTIPLTPSYSYVPQPHLSIFTIGKIDPEVMAEKALPILHPVLYWDHTVHKEEPATTTDKLPLQTILDHEDREDTTLQVSEAAPHENTSPSVKKMLVDDEFQWPGPFTMERHYVKRSISSSSPTKLSLDVLHNEDHVEDSELANGHKLSTESNHAPKEFSLPIMKSEAIPVISVPGDIPELGKFNVIKEFNEPASTAEPPIVLKVESVPTHVDTSEFWNTRNEDHIQESSTIYSLQNSKESGIHTILEGLSTTENNEMRESKMLEVTTNSAEAVHSFYDSFLSAEKAKEMSVSVKDGIDQDVTTSMNEEKATDNLDGHSEQTSSITDRFLETTTASQGEKKMSISQSLFRKEAGESSDESVSNESTSSSEEDEAADSTHKPNSENYSLLEDSVDQTIPPYSTKESLQDVTHTLDETSTASVETTTIEGPTYITDAQPESLAHSITKTPTEYTESASDGTTTSNDSDLYVTEEASTATIFETSTDPREPGSSDTTTKTPVETTILSASTTPSDTNTTSTPHGSTAWDPDFDFVVEEFSSSHIAKDDIPDEYIDYSLSLFEELAKTMSELRVRSAMLKAGSPASKQMLNESQSLTPTTKQKEVESFVGNKYSQLSPMVTRQFRDEKEKESRRILQTTFQDEAEYKKPHDFQQDAASSRSRRQAKHRELPSSILKLLKDKGFDTDAMLNRRGSSASNNQIPTPKEKLSKSRSQKILLSLSDKQKKTFEDDDDAENETDSGNSVDKDASIMELINLKRVHHILADKEKKEA